MGEVSAESQTNPARLLRFGLQMPAGRLEERNQKITDKLGENESRKGAEVPYSMTQYPRRMSKV